MPQSNDVRTPMFFTTPMAFRGWLERNGSNVSELLVGFYKVGSAKPSLTWSESVDVALCFGWIDGVRKRIDDQSYQIRFSPRRPGSTWSAINMAKVEALTLQKRMRPSGLAAFARRTERNSGVYSYERHAAPTLSEDELKRFKLATSAWKYFQGTPPSYQRVIVHWVISSKRASTRARRFSRLIEACAAAVRLLP